MISERSRSGFAGTLDAHNLYGEIMKLLKHRMVSNCDMLAPLYICSIGCHVFNIVNKKSLVYNEGAMRADSRLHIIMVTVPGFGKSFMLKQFLNAENGILSNTRLKPRFCGSMTTAALIGSVKSNSEGEPVIHEGIASKYDESVFGIHEFAEITNSMKQQYNIGLIDALLSILDDGYVNKDVLSGEIKFQTAITMFSAVQPARYDLTSGLGRRLAFLVYIPSNDDISKLRVIMRQSMGVKDDVELLNRIRSKVDGLFDKCNGIKSIRFTERFYSWMDVNNIIPYEEILYKRIGIGYCVMNDKIENGELIVDVDAELNKIFVKQKADRYSVKSGVDNDQVWQVIKDCDMIKKSELIETLLAFSLSKEKINTKLNNLVALKQIKIEGDYIKVTKRVV